MIHIGWLIGTSSSSILMFVCFMIFSIINYKKRFQLEYDLRNHFPYELNYDGKYKDNLFGNICLTLSMLFSLAFFSLTSGFFVKNAVLIFCLIAGAIYSAIVFFLPFVNLKRIYIHVVTAVMLSCFAFLTPASVGLVAFQQFQIEKSIFCLVIFIISVIFGLFNFVLIMNPKFSFNIQMKKVKLETGEEKIERPKIIVIALSEWIMMFSIFITQLLLILVLINL